LSSERLGAPITVELGRGKLEMRITPVYPDESEDAIPVTWHVKVSQVISDTSMNRDEVQRLLTAFGGISNLW
jgi:hypothetical protein